MLKERNDVPKESVSASVPPSLLVRLRALDADAWRRLTELFGPVVYDWCRSAGLQAADAADVGQEVFQAVAGSLPNFRKDRPGDTFRGWLWAITQFKLRDHWRRRGRSLAEGGTTAQQRLHEIPAVEDPSSSAPAGSDRGLFHRALEQIRAEFEDRTWKAFWRATVDERPPAEVAAELGMSAGAVYVAKSRVLRRLREELGELIE